MTTPYADGYKTGRADKRLNGRSLYAWSVIRFSLRADDRAYSDGYRDGWNGAPAKSDCGNCGDCERCGQEKL